MARTAEAGAIPVDVVDTVGAGDAFEPGFVDAALRGPPGQCLSAGADVAAGAVTRP